MKNLFIKEFDVMLMTCFCHFIYEFISTCLEIFTYHQSNIIQGVH